MWTRFFWTFFAGPLAALLPERWRNALPMAGRVHWERAAAWSGFLELLASIVALGFWYWHTMTRVVSGGLDAAISGKLPETVNEHQIGGVALFVFATHPLTWLLAYGMVEGAVRFCGAAFVEDAFGSLPLFLLERTIYVVRNRKELRPGEFLREQRSLFVESVRERLMVARLEELPDALHHTRDGTDDTLEIWASRRKQEWVAPKIVRVDDVYYRLEETSVENGSRPFHYRLRRLEAGVPGRSVILYKTADAVVKD